MVESGIKQTFPSNLTDSSTTVENELGTLRFDGGNIYQYVQASDTTVATNVVSWVANSAVGTNDYKVYVAIGSVTAVAGVAVGSIATNSYGWIQVAGVAECIGDGDIAGLVQVISATDGTVDSWSDTHEHEVMGVAVENDIATSFKVQVRLKNLI